MNFDQLPQTISLWMWTVLQVLSHPLQLENLIASTPQNFVLAGGFLACAIFVGYTLVAVSPYPQLRLRDKFPVLFLLAFLTGVDFWVCWYGTKLTFPVCLLYSCYVVGLGVVLADVICLILSAVVSIREWSFSQVTPILRWFRPNKFDVESSEARAAFFILVMFVGTFVGLVFMLLTFDPLKAMAGASSLRALIALMLSWLGAFPILAVISALALQRAEIRPVPSRVRQPNDPTV